MGKMAKEFAMRRDSDTREPVVGLGRDGVEGGVGTGMLVFLTLGCILSRTQ